LPQVAPTKVKGLKLLPSAAPSAGSDFFRLMVRDCIAMLDAELAAQLPPLPPRRSSRFGRTADSPVSPQRRTVRDDLFAGLINSDSDDESDDDWAADLEREQKLVVRSSPACLRGAGSGFDSVRSKGGPLAAFCAITRCEASILASASMLLKHLL
jgi:hypothetical protein